jgi:hypothetical protein
MSVGGPIPVRSETRWPSSALALTSCRWIAAVRLSALWWSDSQRPLRPEAKRRPGLPALRRA